jgi:hypothetical protein
MPEIVLYNSRITDFATLIIKISGGGNHKLNKFINNKNSVVSKFAGFRRF